MYEARERQTPELSQSFKTWATLIGWPIQLRHKATIKYPKNALLGIKLAEDLMFLTTKAAEFKRFLGTKNLGVKCNGR